MKRKKWKNQDAESTTSTMHSEGSNPQKLHTVLLSVILVLMVVQTIAIFTMNSGSSSSSQYSPQSALPQASPPMQQAQTAPGQQNPAFQIDPSQAEGQANFGNQPPTGQPHATFATYSEISADLGTMRAGESREHTFTVTNSGNEPLVYSGISGDAGLEVVSYPMRPIAPGGNGEIKVRYHANPDESPRKILHINSNTEPGHVHLEVAASVAR